MSLSNTLALRIRAKLAEKAGDASSDTMIMIIIGIALAIVVVSVLTSSFGDIAATVVAKLKGMISGTG